MFERLAASPQRVAALRNLFTGFALGVAAATASTSYFLLKEYDNRQAQMVAEYKRNQALIAELRALTTERERAVETHTDTSAQ